MKLAFLINAHKDAPHLRNLIDSLPADAEYYIHLDHRRDHRHFSEVLEGTHSHIIKHSVGAIPGTLSEVGIQLALIRAALESGDADRLVSIDGLDYPLWSNERIKSHFETLGDKEMLQGISMMGQGHAAYPYCDFQLLPDHTWRAGTWKYRARSMARRALKGTHVHKTLSIHCPGKTYTLYKGGTTWAITRQLAEKIVNEWEQNMHLRKYFVTSYHPVDTFIPTVAFNSSFADNCMLTPGRYKGKTDLQPLTCISGRTARTLTEDDFDMVSQSGMMFCRNVVSGYSDGLRSLIDAARRGDTIVSGDEI